MKTRYFGFAAIVLLQACSTASTSEVNVVHAVEPTAKVECKPIASFLARYTQDQKIYRWEDEEGNVYYGDSLPPESAEKPESPGSGQAEKPEDVITVKQLLEGPSLAQCRTKDLYVRNLRHELACLKVAADLTEGKEDKEDHEYVLQKIRATRQVIERYQEDFSGSGENPCLSSN